MDFSLSTEANWSELYIDGEWSDAEDGATIQVEDPSTHEPLARVAHGTEADVDAAYEAAASASESWADTPPARRESVIRSMAALLEEHDQEVMRLLAAEAGGTESFCGISVQLTLDHAGEAATIPRRMKGEHAPSNIPGKEDIVERVPAGVVPVLCPLHLPLTL